MAKALLIKNDRNYNLAKAAEELQELALAITQQLNKPEKDLSQEIIDEIGDVKIRMQVLELLFPTDQIEKRVQHKIAKFTEYIKKDKFNHI